MTSRSYWNDMFAAFAFSFHQLCTLKKRKIIKGLQWLLSRDRNSKRNPYPTNWIFCKKKHLWFYIQLTNQMQNQSQFFGFLRPSGFRLILLLLFLHSCWLLPGQEDHVFRSQILRFLLHRSFSVHLLLPSSKSIFKYAFAISCHLIRYTQ